MEDIFSDLVGSALKKDLMSALEAAEMIVELNSREKQKAFCTFACDCVRKIFMIRKGMQDISNAAEQEILFFSNVASRCREDFCEKASGCFDRASQLIERNVNPKILFCDLADRIYLCI